MDNLIKKWAMIWADTSPKIYKCQISILNFVQHHMSLRNFMLKQQDTTSYLWNWQKSETLTTPSVDKEVNNRNPNSLLVGMQNDTVTLEGSLAVSYKAEHILIIQSINCSH